MLGYVVGARQHAAEYLAPYLDEMDFRDPVIPLESCLDGSAPRTGAEVRDLFKRNLPRP